MQAYLHTRDRFLSIKQDKKLPPPGWHKITVLGLCIGFSLLLSIAWSHKFRATYGGTDRVDFGEIYYGARTAVHHQDPYNADAALETFRAEGGTFPSNRKGAWATAIVIALDVNLPTTLFLALPLTTLSYAGAQVLWILFTVVLLVTAGCLVWTAGDTTGPGLCGFLIGIILANCQQLFLVGNVAGIAVSLCVFAAWCFLKERYIPIAVVLFALGLALKPHDVGFVWLYFVLVGGAMRKRALQTLAVTCVLGLAAAIWITPLSPHWLHELHDNHVTVSELGSTSDPSPAGLTSGNVGAVLDLQAALSVIMPDPRSYNLASYLVVGSLVAVWGWIVLRRRMTPDRAWLALAVIAVLSLLPVYHRPYDAKLLLLAIPACAKLWSDGGAKRWLSFGFTLAGILFTSDLGEALIVRLSVGPSTGAPPDQKVMLLSLVPPAALLAMGCFYLWMLIRETSAESVHAQAGSANELMAVSAAG